MSSLLFYSGNCKICKSLLATIKSNKLEKYFILKQIEEIDIIDITEIINAGIEIVPTIVNNNFYYEKEECNDFVISLTQYIKYSVAANMIITTENLILNEEEKCVICMGSFEVGESVQTFYCTHKFHKECSITWRKTKNICPTCGKSMATSLNSF